MVNTTMNLTDIWKQVSNIGKTEFINVADGTKRVVPWGHLEWFGFAATVFWTMAFPVALGLIIAKGYKLF